MSLPHEKQIKREILAKGNYLTFIKDTVVFPSGRETTRDIVQHPGAVTMAAITDKREIILVRQYRYAIDREILEVPAGKLSPGEDPLETAKRELSEETGFTAKKWEQIFEAFVSPGYTQERMWYFIAEDLTLSTPHPDDDEYLEIVPVALDKTPAMIANGEIRDNKSLVLLQALFLRYNIRA